MGFQKTSTDLAKQGGHVGRPVALDQGVPPEIPRGFGAVPINFGVYPALVNRLGDFVFIDES